MRRNKHRIVWFLCGIGICICLTGCGDISDILNSTVKDIVWEDGQSEEKDIITKQGRYKLMSRLKVRRKVFKRVLQSGRIMRRKIARRKMVRRKIMLRGRMSVSLWKKREIMHTIV